MHHRHFKLVGATALLAIAGLLGSLLIAPAAPASTINACQKKKGGTIRIVSSKAKCKSTEKKIKWSTTGSAGKNGTNGSNGLNGSNGAVGTNGAAGLPQKAFTFDATSDVGFLAGINTPLFSIGDVSVRMACVNIIANIEALQVTGPAGTRAQAGMATTRTDNTATQNQQALAQDVAVGTNTGFVTLATNSSGTLSNKGIVTGSVTTPTTVILIHAYIEVGPAPSACTARGSAIAIPR